MTTTEQHELTTAEAGCHAADRYNVTRVTAEHVYFATPAVAMNASDYLNGLGFDTIATRNSGQWCVRVF